MMFKKKYSLEDSGAFVEKFVIEPYQNGELDGLKFAVKDNIDLAGKRTSYGSKPWGENHINPVYNALCVDQLLGAGATCIGKTVADEFTYSLDGESYFFGTPLNPKAPDRIPGGSSNGSASAVACELVDFSIGTDSAGSIRVPASFCGIWGMRPTLHRVSEAGVLPFMPSVSTVGVFSNGIQTLEKVMHVLLRSQRREPAKVNNIFLLTDAFSLADSLVKEAVEKSISHLKNFEGVPISWISISDIVGDEFDLSACNEKALRNLQTAEFNNTVGGWIEAVNPELGYNFKAAYQNVLSFDRTDLNKTLYLCETLFDRISIFMNSGDLFCYPTTPTVAPYKGSLSDLDCIMDFYNRTMAICSFAGLGRLPEISIPIADIEGVPLGVSLVAGNYQDEFLLSAAKQFFNGDA
jgi:amidase